MQRAREVFFLYALENVLTIALCFVLGRHSLAGLTASVSIAYSVSAVIALVVLGRHHVRIGSVIWSHHVRRSLWASLLATLVMALAYSGPTWSRGAGLAARFLMAFVLGVITYGLVVLVQQWRSGRGVAKDVRLDQF